MITAYNKTKPTVYYRNPKEVAKAKKAEEEKATKENAKKAKEEETKLTEKEIKAKEAKAEKKSWKKINLDYEGSITYSFFYSNEASLKIFNCLTFLEAGFEVKIMIGGINFFTGTITELAFSTPSLVTSVLTLTLKQKLDINLKPFLKKSTFEVGDSLKDIIPTAFKYEITNEYTFNKYDEENQEAFECINERARDIITKEKLGPVSLNEKGEFCFNTKENLPKVSAKLHILNEKVQANGIIELNIIPNKNVIAGLNFNIKIANSAYYKRKAIVEYSTRSSSLSFSSHKGASQKIIGINADYVSNGGK